MNNLKGKKVIVKGLVAFVIVLIPSIFLLGMLIYEPFSQSVNHYEQLMEVSSARKAPKDSTHSYVATQQRVGVSKELYFDDDTHRRLHVKILSKNSNLALQRSSGRTEVIETLNGVKFFMQEELFYQTPEGKEVVKGGDGKLFFRGDISEGVDVESGALIPMQIIRYVEADAASYNFHSEHLNASNALVSRYRTQGHTLPEAFDDQDLLMKGNAESVTLTIIHNKAHFSAERLEAQFFTPRGLY